MKQLDKNIGQNRICRDELIHLREKAKTASKIKGLAPDWKRAYENLAQATDYVDAMMARCMERKPNEPT